MRLADVKANPGSKRKRRRLGRGISAGQGASCGKGMRGQKARSGRSTRPGFEGGQMPLYRRVPKLKHFPLVNRQIFTLVNVRSLNRLPEGFEVTLDSLMHQGIVTTNDGPLKILGDGDLGVRLTVKASAFTKTAKAKIEAVGGEAIVVDTKPVPNDDDGLAEPDTSTSHDSDEATAESDS